MSLAPLVKSTPIIAIAPILTISIGFGGPQGGSYHTPHILPGCHKRREGCASCDVAILDWARSIDAPRREVFVQLAGRRQGPSCAALKVAAPLSPNRRVVAESVGASSGLGRRMWVAYTNLDMPSLFAAVLAWRS